MLLDHLQHSINNIVLGKNYVQATSYKILIMCKHCSYYFYGYKYMKIVRRKYPDCLADSCKRSSVNRMAAGLRLPRSSHGFFLLSPTFQTYLV